MSHLALKVAAVCCVLVSCAATTPAAGPQYRSVPDDGKITLTDYGCRDWGPDLVHYTVDPGRFKPGKVVLLGADGKAVPCQVDGNVLSFVASVKKGTSATYTLHDGTPDPNATTLKVQAGRDRVEVGNEFFTLVLPGVGTTQFENPQDATTVPTPLVKWQAAGGPLMGACRFADPRKVQSCSFATLHNGPAWFEYEARYRFAPVGDYVCRVSVSPGIPLARITEEVDSGQLQVNNKGFLLLDLHKGWTPQCIRHVVQGSEIGLSIRDDAVADYLAKRKQEAFGVSGFGGTGAPPPPVKPDDGLFLLERMVPGGKWGGLTGGIAVAATMPAQPGGPLPCVGVVPLSVGEWRRTMALNAWGKDGAGVTIGLPLDARWVWWQYDCTDERSPFSSHEHDRSLKESYARRVWALYFGDDLQNVQTRSGFIGLDRYKEWVLDWPEAKDASGKPKFIYPRAFFTPGIAAEVKKTLDQHPDKDVLSRFYAISGKTEDAVRHGSEFLGWIKSPAYQWNTAGLSHYRQAESLREAYRADDALACPELPAEMRADIRRYLALWACLLSDPDFNPRGAGVHLGNPNMSFNRTLALACFAPLLPDHPRYDYWMTKLSEFTRFKLATHTAPDGTWLECPNYELYGPIRFLDTDINALRSAGGADFTGGYQARVLRYTASLTVPDVRFNGLRIIPGMGNSGDIPESIFGVCMRSAGPQMAGFLRMMHRLSVGPNGVARLPANPPYFAFNFQPAVPEAKETLATMVMPTYGVIFRNHFGTPDETAFYFRTGINWSHWDTDIFNVILYGKGAPLSPGTGYGYGPACMGANNAIYHNQVKIVAQDKKEVFGRVDAPLRDYGFGQWVDYAMADRYYPPELYEDKTERHWRRHVMFLKSERPGGADYFVMRDTFPGNPATDRSWWTWLNLGEADMIAVGGQALSPAQTPHDTVPELDKLSVVTGNAVEMKTAFGAGTHIWFSGEPLGFRARLTFKAGMYLPFDSKLPMLDFSKCLPDKTEVKTILEGMAAPGKDYFYVVYPHKDGEAVPPMKRLADGCIKTVTAEATDYAFLSDSPLAFQQEDVVFTGKAGAVRVMPGRVVLSMTSGSGRVGYKGCVLEGHGPFERSIAVADLKPGVTKVEGGYEKKMVRVDLGRGVVVTGEAPLEAALDGDAIRIKTSGRARVLNVTQPQFIRRPQYWLDGQEWMACWTDWPDSGFGSFSHTDMMALSVPEGEHELVVKDLVFPPVWERTFQPAIEGVVRE